MREEEATVLSNQSVFELPEEILIMSGVETGHKYSGQYQLSSQSFHLCKDTATNGALYPGHSVCSTLFIGSARPFHLL